MVRILMILAIVVGVVTASSCQQDNDQEAPNLIGAFGNSCLTTGAWSQQAIAHSAAIATIIQNISSNSPCKQFQASLGSIQSASTQIQGLVQDQAYQNYRNAEESVQYLTLGLQGTDPNGPLGQALSQALVQAQVTLAQSQAANVVDQAAQGQNRYATATAQLATLAQQMLQQSDGLAQCFQEQPSVAVELATNLAAIGGSFVSPIYGAGAAVVGQLINFAIAWAQSHQEAQKLWQVYQAEMPTALGCGLEAMTELYCNAGDAEQLLTLSTNSHIGEPVPDFWQGMDLLNNRMPVLDTWLLSIRNGVLPGDPQEAARQDVIWQKLATLDQTFRDVYGLQQQQQLLYDASANNPTNQQNILVKAILNSIALITGTAGGFSQNPPPNPFTDQTTDPDVFACWLALGPQFSPPNPLTPNAPNMCPLHIQNTQDTGESYIRNHLITGLKFSNIIDNWNGLYITVKNAVDVEFSQTITANPDSIIAAAKEASVNNLSPYQTLSAIAAFLQMQLTNDDGTNPAKPPFIQGILQLITKAQQIIDGQASRSTVDSITQLFNMFQLAHGLQYFDSSLVQIINWDLADRVRNKQFPTNINDILFISGSDLAGRLDAAGVSNLDAVNIDLNKARSISSGNLAAYMGLFSDDIGRSIQSLHDNAISHGEPADGPDRPYGQSLGHLCTLILASSTDWPKSLPWAACEGAVLDSIFPDPDNQIGIHVADLAKQLQGKPFTERACALHRFLQASRYAEIYGKTPGGNSVVSFISGVK